MGSAASMISRARNSLGTVEHPAGSNHNFITEWYGFDGAWCDMSISYWAYHSDNAAAMGGKFAYTVAHAQWFKNQGRWHYGTSGIKAGDIIFYQWEGGSKSISKIDHVGLVEYVSGGVIHTIEGNRSDRCGRFTTVAGSSVVTGYGRPAYGSNSPVPSNGGGSGGSSILQNGSTGAAVKTLQKNLNTLGYSVGTVDGEFGPKTESAVKKFQKDHGLTVDGQAGPKTLAAINKALNPQNEDDMSDRLNVGWSGSYTLPADNKWHTLSFNKVWEDSGSQRAKNGTNSSTIMSSKAKASLDVFMTFSNLTGQGVQVRVIQVAKDSKGKFTKVASQSAIQENPATPGNTYAAAHYTSLRNEKGRKTYVQVKNISGKPAKMTSAGVTADIVKLK